MKTPKTNTTKIAIGYTRVSTAEQSREGHSLSAQAEKIRAMSVVLDGVELADVIVDAGQSAKNLSRPGMEQLLSLVNSGKVQTVIVAKLDRLTRSVKDLAHLLETFERKGVSLVSVAETLDTGTAAGRLVLNIMVSVSQWERETIGERTAEVLQHKRAQGFKTGGNVPFGFVADESGKLSENAAEMAIVAKIRALQADGFSLKQIADELNAQGITTRKGTSWRREYIHAIVRAAA